MKNNSLREIGDAFFAADTIMIFPHILMDGDALGSAAALCRALRNMGKTAYISVEDKVPDYLAFLDDEMCTYDQKEFMNPDISVCVDCGDETRYPNRKELFESGKLKICIDHHGTSKPACDLVYIEPDAAATGELIYLLLCEMNQRIEPEIASALFAAITTDTGNFQYQNTTKRTHEIVTKLYDSGFDAYSVSVNLYENEPITKIKLQSKVLDGAEKFAGGKGIIACVTQEMLKEMGALMEETEGLTGTLRSIAGVEVAILCKETEIGEIKASLRSKNEGNVARISAKFDGGGHEKAAGCTINESMEDAKKMLVAETEKELCKAL